MPRKIWAKDIIGSLYTYTHKHIYIKKDNKYIKIYFIH